MRSRFRCTSEERGCKPFSRCFSSETGSVDQDRMKIHAHLRSISFLLSLITLHSIPRSTLSSPTPLPWPRYRLTHTTQPPDLGCLYLVPRMALNPQVRIVLHFCRSFTFTDCLLFLSFLFYTLRQRAILCSLNQQHPSWSRLQSPPISITITTLARDTRSRSFYLLRRHSFTPHHPSCFSFQNWCLYILVKHCEILLDQFNSENLVRVCTRNLDHIGDIYLGLVQRKVLMLFLESL